ncbi:MAG: xylulokinase [Oscillospiraceae bacterium]
MKYLLGLDIGTTNIKAVAVDAHTGGIAACESLTYEIETPCAKRAQYSPHKWYLNCCGCIRSLIKKSGILPNEIASIGLSGQMHGLVALDENKDEVYPAILHLDKRSGDQLKKLYAVLGQKYISETMMNAPYTGYLLASLMWLKDNEAELYARIKHVMLPKDFILQRLTGELVTDYSDASASFAFDVKKRKWASEALVKLEISEALFPKVLESCDIAGTVTKKAAEDTGLAAGTPVICGGGDAVMQALGNGVCAEGSGIINIGTSGQVLFVTDVPYENPTLSTNTFCAFSREKWVSMGAIMSAGSAFRWISNRLGERDLRDLDERIKKVPARGNKVLFLPHLNGERTPYLDPELRGVMLGFGTETTNEELAGAVMEGVCLELYLCYEVCRGIGLDADSFIMSGGGSHSRVWVQMMCDVFGKPIKVAGLSEQAAAGAAMCAGVGVGIYADIEQAAGKIARFSQTVYMPDMRAHERYADILRLFKKAHASNRELLHELSALGKAEE